MVNERLRRAMLRAGYDTETLAEAAGVAGKSVQRWIAGDVTPYPRTRYRVAALLSRGRELPMAAGRQPRRAGWR